MSLASLAGLPPTATADEIREGLARRMAEIQSTLRPVSVSVVAKQVGNTDPAVRVTLSPDAIRARPLSNHPPIMDAEQVGKVSPKPANLALKGPFAIAIQQYAAAALLQGKSAEGDGGAPSPSTDS